MARLCRQPILFDLPDLGGDVCEVRLDGLEGLSASPVRARLGQISVTQLLDLRCRGDVLVFGAGEVERGLLHEPRWLRTFEENEVLVLPHGIEGYEMQLV